MVMRQQRITQPLPGARESSAGDDFHILWAARRALDLLDARADLTAISVEGPHPDEAAELDSGGEHLLALDLVEYYGGTTFQDARNVSFCQLKYSTRNPGRAWTAARLCAGREGNEAKSIIAGLARAFARYEKEYGAQAVATKLRLKLISNQPLSQKLQQSLNRVSKLLSRKTPVKQVAASLGKLNRHEQEEIGRLRRASGLDNKRFVIFLAALDLSACGEVSRDLQRTQLFASLESLGLSENQRGDFSKLKEAIRQRMMPEQAALPPLDRHSLLPVFGIGGYGRLFPCPSELSQDFLLIDRPFVAELARVVVDSNKPVLLHATGGVGKTTTLLGLDRHLPPGAVHIIYDCYGAGEYLNTGGARHTPGRAFVQLANELARHVGTSFLLPNDGNPVEDLVADLCRRLITAVTALRTIAPEAIIVLTIDAADNGIYAAANRGQRSFVFDLLNQRMPEGVRLLVSCRTENISRITSMFRQELLRFFDLPRFDEDESAAHLRLYIEDATDDQAREFHALTHDGVPRVQKYLLDRPFSSFDDLLKPVRPDGKGLDELFDTWLEEAYRRSGATASLDRLRAVLIILRRPLPLRVVARVAGEHENIIRSFCADAGRGILVQGEEISFRDQDFEDYLQRRAHETSAGIVEQIATQLLQIRHDEPYAARFVHFYLENAGKTEELQDLVFTEGKEIRGLDPVEASSVFLARLISAIRAADPGSQQGMIFRLLFLAAEAKKRDLAVRKLIIENAGLALRYSDPENVRTLGEQLVVDDGWPAPGHWKKARIFSLHRETFEKARTHLREAEGWVQSWSARPRDDEEDRPHWHRIENAHLANAVEAIARLASPEKAYRWLSRWRPRGLAAHVIPLVMRGIVAHEGLLHVLTLAGGRHWRADLSLFINGSLLENGACLDPDKLRHLATTWRRFTRVKQVPQSLRIHMLELCEQLARLGPEEFQMAADLLPHIRPESPSYPEINRFGDGPKWGPILRWLILCEVVSGEETDVNALLPAALEPLGPIADSDDRQTHGRTVDQREKMDKLYRLLLRPFRIRMRVLLAGTLGDGCAQLVGAIEGPFRHYPESHRYDADELRQLLLSIAADTVANADAGSEEAASALVGLLRNSSRGWVIKNLLLLASRFSYTTALQAVASELLDEAKGILAKPAFTGSEKIDYLLQMATISRRFHERASAEFFRMALEAAEEVDEEAPYYLRALAALASRVKTHLTADSSAACQAIARYSEQSFAALGHPDHWPWEEIFRGIATMDPASLPVILARWDDRGFRKLELDLADALAILVEGDFCDPVDALCLSVISYPYYRLRPILDKLSARERETIFPVLQMLERDVLVVLSPDAGEKAARIICEWAEANGYRNNSSIVRIREFILFRDPFTQTPPSARVPSSVTSEGGMELEQKTVECPAPSEPFTGEVLEQFLSSSENSREKGHYSSRRALLGLADRISLSRRCSFLEALLQCRASASFPNLDILAILEDLKEKWARDVAIRAWFTNPERAERFISRHCFSYFTGERWNRILRVFSLPVSQCAGIALSALTERVTHNSVEELYTAIEALVATLAPSDAATVMRHELERVDGRLHPDSGDGTWEPKLKPPNNANRLFAQFLWKVLGHPDKRLRWRGAHAVRRLTRSGRAELLECLVGCWNMKELPPFCDHRSPFFWLSARTWLLMVLDRIAADCPQILKSHSSFLFNQAVGCDPPHAMQRHYAKQACLKLASHDGRLFSRKKIEQLQRINISPFPERQSPKEGEISDPTLADVEYDYQFDTMDTIPYWFSRLRRIFPVTMEEIEVRAARHICERWGFTGETGHSYPTMRGRDEDGDLTSHRHGDEPTIERLDRYLDWHSMMCVASELLEVIPLADGEWDGDETDLFEGLLQSWTPHFPDIWLSDLLQAMPQEPTLRTMPDYVSEDWDLQLPWNLFDGYLLSSEQSFPQMFTVSGNFEASNFSGWERVSITSALINTERAHSLMASLQTCANVWRYAIPQVGDRETGIVQGNYRLTGWLLDHQAFYGYTDEKDPLRRSLGMPLPMLGDDFLKYAGASLGKDYCEFRDERGRLVGLRQFWDDIPPYRRSEDSLRGRRLLVDSNLLLSYLRKKNSCLLIQCSIDRQKRRKEHDYAPQKAKIYLLHSDGRLESLPENPLAGEADRKRSGDGG